jgi:hypothetical protein
MKILTLKVDDRIADAYNSATDLGKAKMNELANALLAEVVRKNQAGELFKIIDKISEEASTKGLTPEKLGELMGWNDETLVNLFGKNYLMHG